ncbi:hypothetical protein F0562_008156 [Nyssa sinensis]|uniref:RING-type domain-containing protein n=1 Tax=Nyssa sinensis TaxID=561372 RepID=A0A5J5ABD1_9ASTE|nr:hypothetical protein F0562_008156 [Nyssa sinensis]
MQKICTAIKRFGQDSLVVSSFSFEAPHISFLQGFKSNMGLSNYPTPADGGVLIVILVNTAISISIVKDIVLSILHVVGIHISSGEEYSIESPSESYQCHRSPSEAYMEELRSRTPAVRFDSVCSNEPEQECSVCLTQFEPDSDINHLSCGHVFHKLCLEKWLKHWNVTCPLCRTRMVPLEEEEDTCPMSHILPGLPASSESLEPAANSDSLEPRDTLLRVRLCFLWYRQRKDPACVVGEHKQLYFTLDVFLSVIGDDGVEEDISAEFFTSSKFIV